MNNNKLSVDRTSDVRNSKNRVSIPKLDLTAIESNQKKNMFNNPLSADNKVSDSSM